MSAYITIEQRIVWGQAVLNTCLKPAVSADVLPHYCQIRTGHQALYDSPDNVAADALSDVLHALTAEQLAEASYERVIQPEELDATAFNQVATLLCHPDTGTTAGIDTLTEQATFRFLTEQEDALSGE